MLKFIAMVSLMFSVQAQADRYVIKNPSSTILESEFFAPGKPLRVLDMVELNGDNYVLVTMKPRVFSMDPEDREGIADTLQSVFSAEVAEPDRNTGYGLIPIEQEDEDLFSDSYHKGWHTEKHMYEKISNRADGSEIVVAVIDTGVDYNHEAMQGKIWVNEGEIPDNGFDDDENGYVDDVIGYNFFNDNNNPMDGHSHGTHVAGTIASEPHDDHPAKGIAPSVKIMPLQIFSSSGRFAGVFNTAKAIKYATDNGAHLSNNSWGGGGVSEVLKGAIEYANDNGTLFVAAAGNSSSDNDRRAHYPSSYEFDNIVAVSAMGRSNRSYETPASFTSYGKESVDIASAGFSVFAPVPGNRWESFSGTSMATPIVSGLLALGMQLGMEPLEAKQKLIQTAEVSELWKNKLVANGFIDPIRFLSSAE